MEADLETVTFCIGHNHTLYILYPLASSFGSVLPYNYCLLSIIYTSNVYRDLLISWG